MARTSSNKRASVTIEAPKVSQEAIAADLAASDQLAAANEARARQLVVVDARLGLDIPYQYEAVKAEVRVRLTRAADDLFETGRLLMLMKEHEPHGQFMEAIDELGVPYSTARRMMQATLKFSDPRLAPLQALPRTKLYELMTEDPDDLAVLAEGGTIADGLELDDVDRMSATELRAALRKRDEEVKADSAAKNRLLEAKNKKIDELEQKLDRRATLTPDERAAEIEAQVAQQGIACSGALLPLRGLFAGVAQEYDRLPAGIVAAMQAAVARQAVELRELAADFGIDIDWMATVPEWDQGADGAGIEP